MVVMMMVMMMNLAVSSNMLAIVRAVEKLPVEQLDRDHSKYELEIMILFRKSEAYDFYRFDFQQLNSNHDKLVR